MSKAKDKREGLYTDEEHDILLQEKEYYDWVFLDNKPLNRLPRDRFAPGNQIGKHFILPMELAL